MNSLSNLWKYWASLWEEWTLLQRASVLAGALLCVTLVGGVGIWATRPEYVTLIDRLNPADAAEAVSALESAGITYRLNFSGSAVLVSRSQLAAARMAIRDVAPAAAGGEDPGFGGGLWSDPAVTQVRLLREQEHRLARSISQIRAVRNATVHISKPESSPFVRDKAPPKASVIVDLQPGVPFSATEAQGIVMLVAHSVEGLDPSQVSVMDTQGRQFSGGGTREADIAGRLAFQRDLETELAAKAEAMLAQLLGPGHATVRVTADIDFTEVVRRETTFDPDAKVKLSEEIETETTTQPASDGAKAAGVASNLGSVSGNSGRSTVVSKRERNNTQYENARIEDTVTEVPGSVKRLTVAAVVHMPKTEGDEAAAPVDKSLIESIVKQTVGFDETRQDGIEVLIASGPRPEPVPLIPPASEWEQYERLIQAGSLGIAAVVALVYGLLILRRLRPVVVEVPSRDGLSIDAARRLAELAQKANERPDAASRVLAAWLKEADEEESHASRSAA